MNREQAYMRMLSSTVNMQWNIALMLEAKAAEAEKMKGWIYSHLNSHTFNTQQAQVDKSLQMHDQVIEVIDSICKLNQGIVSTMKAVLQQEPEISEGFGNAIPSLGQDISFGNNNR